MDFKISEISNLKEEEDINKSSMHMELEREEFWKYSQVTHEFFAISHKLFAIFLNRKSSDF